MTKNEQLKKVAEYMGGKFFEDTPLILSNPIVSPSGNAVKCIDKLKYHYSWDWLMPVWSKLRGELIEWDKKPGAFVGAVITGEYAKACSLANISKAFEVVIRGIDLVTQTQPHDPQTEK